MGQEPWELVLQKLDSLEGKVDRTNANVTSMQTDVKMIQADLARTNTLAEKHERVIRGGNGDGVGVDFFLSLASWGVLVYPILVRRSLFISLSFIRTVPTEDEPIRLNSTLAQVLHDTVVWRRLLFASSSLGANNRRWAKGSRGYAIWNWQACKPGLGNICRMSKER
jgi:hypothetical protein